MSSYRVMNCNFSYECHRTWRSLEKTPFLNVRFCDECKKEVFRCTTQEQIDWASQNGFCGAVKLLGDDMVGVLAPPTESEINEG